MIISQKDHSSETVTRGALTFTDEWKLEQFMFNTVTSTGVTNVYLDIDLDRHIKSFYKLTCTNAKKLA